jgi:hypothetical protein
LARTPPFKATPPHGAPLEGSGKKDVPPKKAKSSKTLYAEMMKDDRGELSSLEYANKLVDDLSAFVAPKTNLHTEIKVLITKLQKAMLELSREWVIREKPARKKVAEPEAEVTPRSSKRARQSNSPSTLPKPKEPRTGPQKQKKPEGGAWTLVGGKQKKPPERPKPEKTPQPREARKVKTKSDALLIEAKDADSYAEILRKVKGDPDLKELGNQVARIRRTRKGEMLFELKGDSLAKSEVFKELVQKTLGDVAAVRALTQETVVEICNLDEVTSEAELREALIEQFSLGEIGKTAKVKMRKAYSGTQIGTIKLPVAEANKLLKAGKIKVGWTICHVRIPRTQLLRCYKCLGFGHVAIKCTSTDRKGRCWRCGEEGHVGATCSNKPKCMICQKSEGNNHATGSLRCKAYKDAKAKAHQAWR